VWRLPRINYKIYPHWMLSIHIVRWSGPSRAGPGPCDHHGQIAAALEGRHGDVRFTRRTSDSTLFINPLMAVYFTFDLIGLGRQKLYLDRLEHTIGMIQVASRIEAFARRRRPASRVCFHIDDVSDAFVLREFDLNRRAVRARTVAQAGPTREPATAVSSECCVRASRSPR